MAQGALLKRARRSSPKYDCIETPLARRLRGAALSILNVDRLGGDGGRVFGKRVSVLQLGFTPISSSPALGGAHLKGKQTQATHPPHQS